MPWVGGDDRNAGIWVPEMPAGTQGTPDQSLFYQSWLQGVQPSQPAASSYDAYQRAGDYMTAFQNGPLGLNPNAAAGLTGGLLTESDFFKIYDQPGLAGQWGQQYGTTPGVSGGIGDAQWTDQARHDAYIDYVRNNGYATGQPFGANYGNIERELLGPEGAAYRQLQNATDLQSGVDAGLRFERPGTPHEDWRLANAQATLNNTASPMGWIDSPTGPVWGSTGTSGYDSGYGGFNQFGIPGNSYGAYNPSGLQPSFTGTTNYGYTPSDTGSMSYGAGFQPQPTDTQFSGDPGAGYVNPTFGTDWADPALINLVPKEYSSAGPEGTDSQGRPIWGGYVEESPGVWVVPSMGDKGFPIPPPDWGVGDPGFAAQQPAAAEGSLDAHGRPIWGGYVQNDQGTWVAPDSAGPPSWSPADLGVNTPTSGPGYQYGTGMDFGLPDIAPNAQPSQSSEGMDANGRPIYGGYVQEGDGTWVLPTFNEGANTPNNVGGALPPAYTESANNPNTVAGVSDTHDIYGRPIYGGYIQNDQGIWVAPGSAGPITSGPSYQYGTGMDVGLPDIAPNLPVESANNPNNVGGYVQDTNGGWVTPDTPNFGNFGLAPIAGESGMNLEYAAGVTPTAGYSIQPGTAAAIYGGGLTQQDADTQFANYEALQARLAADAAMYQAGLNALPSSPQNFNTMIAQPYDRNFGGQIAGYNPFSTQYQPY